MKISTTKGLQVLEELRTGDASVEISFRGPSWQLSSEAKIVGASSERVEFALPSGSLVVSLPAQADCNTLDTSVIGCEKYPFHLELSVGSGVRLLVSKKDATKSWPPCD